MQDDGYFPCVTVIYGAGGNHDPMVGGHDTPTGDKTKGALREVEFHASVDFFVSPGLMETCSTL